MTVKKKFTMIPFLKTVAQDVYARFGSDLSRVAIIFPGKRANLFFNIYLSEMSNTPLWAPQYLSINELFHMLSDRKPCDPIEAVCKLHKIYKSLAPDPLDLDAFYGWGEKLLKDFDDLDKNLVAADCLFQNIKAIKEIDNNEFLTPGQKETLADFFRDFSPETNSRLRQNFISIWNILLPLYTGLNQALEADGTGYDGALFRHVAAHIDDDAVRQQLSRYKAFIFVGFNLLSEVERRLLHALKDSYETLFYWDYDVYFTHLHPHHEAGTFIRENLREFGSALDERFFNNFSQPKDLHIVSTLTNASQASYAAGWLRANKTDDARQTGLVLCDETLLLPVLHTLPPEVGEVNITKGYPLGNTPAFSRVEQRLQMLSKEGKADTDQLAVLKELKEMTQDDALENRKALRQHPLREDDILEQLYAESDYQTYTLLCRIERLVEQGTLELSFSTFHALLRRLLRQINIPFHGEPAQGIQLLGMLETRCLDFENLLFLSVNENTLPPSMNVSSFIPHDLRKAFGMTVSEHEISIYAYYFYRLLSRAQRVTFVYNANATGASTGEMSRFLLQLLVESGHSVQRTALQSPHEPQSQSQKSLHIIQKDDSLKRLLRVRESGFPELSPSAINRWLDCRLSFYFRYIAGLPEPAPQKGLIPPNMLGNIFHGAAQMLYNDLTVGNPLITKEQLAPFIKDGGIRLSAYVERSFRAENEPMQIVVAALIERYLQALVKADMELAPFEMKETEEEHHLLLTVPTVWGEKKIKVGGRVDRIDIVRHPVSGEKMLRVVDYKTGGNIESLQSMKSLTAPVQDRAHYSFQVFLYSLALCGETTLPVAPALFYLNHVHAQGFTPYLKWKLKDGEEPIYKFQNYQDEFKETLENVVGDIFNMDVPFTPTPQKRSCAYCAYKDLCGR